MYYWYVLLIVISVVISDCDYRTGSKTEQDPNQDQDWKRIANCFRGRRNEFEFKSFGKIRT